MSTDAAASPRLPAGPEGAYTRKATGLVREGSLIEMMIVNSAAIAGISLGLSIGFFFAAVAFPGANLVLALVIAIIWSVFVWFSFSLLAVSMPRVGGDYVYNSRILHPAIGMATNMTLFVSTVTLGAGSAYYLGTIGIGSSFDTIGAVTGNHWWLTAAQTLSTPTWSMWLALGVGGALTATSIWGTKKALRAMAYTYILALAGVVVATLAMLFTSHSDFISSINSFAGHNAYAKTVAAGAKAGLYGHGYSARNTIGAVFTMMSVTTAAWYSVYLNGEFRGAGQRKRQLWSIVGGGALQSAALLVCGIVFLSTTGEHFFTAATGGNFPVANAAYFSLFSALASGSSVLAVFIALSFLGAITPFIYGNIQMPQRAPLVWALDGLAPKRLSYVNDRTHTPVWTILIAFAVYAVGAVWYRINPHILTIFTYAILFTAVPMFFCQISGLLLPYRRPDLYKGTSAEWTIAGVPVIVVTSAIGALLDLFLIVVITPFHTNVGIAHPWVAYTAVTAAMAGGAIWYFVARTIQAGRGVDLDLSYKTIPSE